MSVQQKTILCLCGGVGGAKLAYGFSKLLTPDHLTIVVNTGDDFEHLGYPISPDLDTVTYTLAEINNKELGWGIDGETWQFMEEQKRSGGEAWFQLGDKDLETHRFRKALLQQGKTLSEVTAALCKKYNIAENIVPMSDDPVHTIIKTQIEELSFQHYFVREQCRPAVTGFYFKGAENAIPSPDFLKALRDDKLDAVIICPSNPFVSIDPILSLPGIRTELSKLNKRKIAISPIIAGQAVKGPTAKMMQELNIPKTSIAIAEHYRDIIDTLILDNNDREQEPDIKKLGINTAVAQTLMKDDQDKIDLARFIIELL